MAFPLIAAAIAAAAIQKANQARTARRQDQAAADSLRRQAEFQRQANLRTDEQLRNLEESGPEEEFRQRSGDIRTQLRRKQNLALAGLQQSGSGSDAFNSMAEAAGGTAVNYGDDINRWLSGIDAAGLQRQGEAFERADVGSALNSLRRNSAQEENLLRLRQAGIRDNPLLSLLSTGLGAYAMSGGLGGNTMAGSAGASGLGAFGNTSPQDFFAASAGANMPFNVFPTPGRRLSGIGMNLGG
jgi:hypothetical protein